MRTTTVLVTYEHVSPAGVRVAADAHYNPIGIWNVYAPEGQLHLAIQNRDDEAAEFRVSFEADGYKLGDVNGALTRGQTMRCSCSAKKQAFISIRWRRGKREDWSQPQVIYWSVPEEEGEKL